VLNTPNRAVQVYYADRRMLSSDAVDALTTADDRRRFTASTSARRRAEHLAGRALLRYALAQYTGDDGSSFRIEVSPAGKPECTFGPAISVSHSGDIVVCAVAEETVGVDVETGHARETEEIAARYFTPAEARWIAGDSATRFRMLWVLKEAYLKAVGLGIAGGLDSLDCRIDPPVIDARTVEGAAPQLGLLAGQGCHVGVAALGSGHPLRVVVHRLAPDDGADAFGPLSLLARTE
jgi:4'-phosphopantetheinyl transferase